MWSCPPSSEQEVKPQGDMRAQSCLPEIPSCPEYLLYLASSWPEATFLYFVPVLLWQQEGGKLQECHQQRFVSRPEHWTPSSTHFHSSFPANFFPYVYYICLLCHALWLSFLFSLLLFDPHQKCLSHKGEQIPASNIPTSEQLKSLWDPRSQNRFVRIIEWFWMISLRSLRPTVNLTLSGHH